MDPAPQVALEKLNNIISGQKELKKDIHWSRKT
jgi:hypothetical protein